MYIKRGAFLILTGVLAQQACSESKLDGDDGDGSGGSSSTGTGGESSGGESSTGSGGETASGGAAAGGADAAGGTDAGGADAAGGSGATGGADAAGGAGGDGPDACDDSVGTPPSCEDATPACDFGLDYCNALKAGLKPKVAEAAVKCFTETNACDDYTYECAATALGAACPVAENDTFCADAITNCSPNESDDELTAAECHALVDGLSESGFAQVYSCVEDGCSYGLWSCIESLNP